MLDISFFGADLFVLKYKVDGENRINRVAAETLSKCQDFVEGMTGIRPLGQGAFRMAVEGQMYDIWISPYVENEQADTE